MANPFDPNVPLYEGQALQQQEVQQPDTWQAAGLHFLEGIGNLVMGVGHFFAGKGDGEDEADEAEDNRSRRHFRPRFPRANPSTRAGKGACCRRSALPPKR